MHRDILFLLDPESVNNDGKARYCPDCALVAGYLAFYPAAARALDVRYVAAPRPLPEIIALLGEAQQGAPVLILNAASTLPSGSACKNSGDHRFIDEPKDILSYLGTRIDGCGLPL